MENKKLVNILLKDMGELQELIAEVKTKGNFDAFEIEFMHTRAKGVMQLLQMLNGFNSKELVEKEQPEIVTPVLENEEVEVEMKSNEIKQIQINEVEEKKEEIIEETESVAENVNAEFPELEKESVQDEVPEESVEAVVEREEISENKEVELEEEEIIEVNPRLGDSFLKGKSVNDLIEDQNNLESKLSNRPVSSIQTAIGINDRFQFIRELFEGNSESFKETVASLDSMNNINEAVSYLQQNFKWKKNETSLKFVNLIKRRFAND